MIKYVKEKWKSQLSFRLFLTILSIFTLFTIFGTFFLINQQINSLKQKYISEGKLLATILANNSRLGVFAENEFLLEEPLNDIIKTQEVLSASIYSTNGKLIKEIRKNKSISQFNNKEMDLKSLPIIDSPIEKKHSFEFWLPIYTTSHEIVEQLFIPDLSEKTQKKQKIIGYARLEIDKTRLTSEINNLILRGIIIFVVFVFLFGIVFFKLTKKMTTSLNNLAEKLSNFGKAGISEYIEVKSNDELGKVALAFNFMIDSLKEREKEKQTLEAQLRQSQKLEAIGTLAGGIAHDFNNVLTAIINCASLLKMYSNNNEQTNTYIDVILRASERAASLTKSLLAFSRKQTIKPQVIDINVVIKDFQNILKRLVTENVSFELNFSDRPLLVNIDITQLDQLIVNLVTNACDAMPDGGTLTITTEYRENCPEITLCDIPCPCAVIKVSDTGIGIEPNIIDKIFDPFFTTKEVGKGTGLGLAMVHGIVKQNNGKITVQSTPGVGTTFSVYFPISQEQKNEDSKKTEFKLENFALLKDKYTILLAEDDNEVRTVISSILNASGYNVIIAKDGEEAITEFDKNFDKINLALLDVIMPKRNGKEVAEHIKKIKSEVKIIFFSGYSGDILNKAGIDDSIMVLSKPLNPETILSYIEKMLC